MTESEVNCRFFYARGLCANKHVDSMECIGPECCAKQERFKTTATPENMGCCGYSMCGLYCIKYRHFFCPGEQHCGSIQEYMAQLAAHRARCGEK